LRRDIPTLRAVASHSSRATFMIAFCSGVGSSGMNSSFETGSTSIGKRSVSDSSIRAFNRLGIVSSPPAGPPDDERLSHRPEIVSVQPAVSLTTSARDGTWPGRQSDGSDLQAHDRGVV